MKNISLTKRLCSILLALAICFSNFVIMPVSATNSTVLGYNTYLSVSIEGNQLSATSNGQNGNLYLIAVDTQVSPEGLDSMYDDSDWTHGKDGAIKTADRTNTAATITLTLPEKATKWVILAYTDNHTGNKITDVEFDTDATGNYVAPKASATVTITKPTADAHLNSDGLKTFAGTAADGSDGNVSKVMWTLADKNGKYWNGSSAFDKNAYNWADVGNTAWTLDLSGIAGKLTDGDTYTLSVYAQDNNTGLDTALMKSVSFVYDTTAPTATFSPASGSALMTGAARTVTINLSEKLYGVNNIAGVSEIAENALTNSGAVTVGNGASGTTDITGSCTLKYVTGTAPKITVEIPEASLTAGETVKVNIVASKLVDSAGNAMAAAAASYTVSDGVTTYMSSTTDKYTYKYAADATLGSTVGAESGLDADTVAKALGLKVGTASGGTGTDLTDNGTWSWGIPAEAFAAGSNRLTLKWTPSNPINTVTYAPCTTTVTVLAKKILGAANFQPNGTTLNKPYDGNNKLPTGAKAEVADVNKIGANAYVVSIEGTYNDATVGTGKQISTTKVTEDTASDYYVLEDPLTALTDLTGDIAQVAPVFSISETEVTLDNAKIENYTVKVNGLDVTTAGLSKATAAETTEPNKFAVYYWVTTPAHYDATQCNCDVIDKLAHKPDCDLVTSNGSTCSCSADPSVTAFDENHQHEESCAYVLGTGTSHCTCKIRDNSLEAQHAEVCGSHVAATSAWTANDQAASYLNGLKVGDTVDVYICLPDATNTNFTTLAKAATVQDDKVDSFTVKSNGGGGGGSSGGGGGSSSYTVKFDAGKNGKITKGNASTSVSSGSKVASSKVPEVTANEGYKFLGWSLDGKTTVDPTEQKITKSVTFTALYEEKPELNKEDHMAYIKGYADGTFKPGNNITRAEVAAIFGRIIKGDDVSGTASYSDVSADSWYAPYIASMSQYGLIKGYNDGTFRPDAPITREEFVAIATRMDGASKAGSLPFSDVAADRWSVDNIYTAYTNGWMKGYEDGTFRPEAKLTRAEAVTAINAILERSITAESIADASYNTFTDVSSTHWAYYDIIEASNAHQYTKEDGKETWTK